MVYLDHAATTPLDPRVLRRMEPFFGEIYGNPNSIHSAGRQAREALEDARALVASLLGATPNEIVFTSGGSESNNLCVRGVASARRGRGRHIVVSAIEHPSVMATCEALQREGFDLTQLEVDRDGIVHPEAVAAAIRSDTILVSVMHSNNEIGTIQPIEAIARIARDRRVYCHTDAVQSVGKLPVHVGCLGADLLPVSPAPDTLSSTSVQAVGLGVDLMSFTAHKFYGPKGVGALYIRSGTRTHAQITGGGQEKNRRSGTENVAGIVGLAEALRLAIELVPEASAAQIAMRDRLIDQIPIRIPDAMLTGHPTLRLPNHASFCFRGVEGEALLLSLDKEGFAASAGSACSAGSLDPPYVLQVLGVPRDYARGSLRLSVGRTTTMADIERLLNVLPVVVNRLRSIGLHAARG